MTALAPFTPKGDLPEWRLVYDRIVNLNVGDTITYDDLAAILGRPFTTARGPMYRAASELLHAHQRAIDNIPGVGYRIVAAAEHEQLSRRQHKAARRRLRRSRDLLTNTDRNQLTPEERERFDRLELQLARQIDFTRRLDGRLSKVEAAIKENRQEQAASAQKVEELSEQVQRLEAALDRRAEGNAA